MNGCASRYLPVPSRRDRGERVVTTYGEKRSAPRRARGAQRWPPRRNLEGAVFRQGFHDPLRRAARTCKIADFGAVAEVDMDLLEWDDGEYEGRRTIEIRTAALYILTHEHDLSEPATRLWNDTRHGAA